MSKMKEQFGITKNTFKDLPNDVKDLIKTQIGIGNFRYISRLIKNEGLKDPQLCFSIY